MLDCMELLIELILDLCLGNLYNDLLSPYSIPSSHKLLFSKSHIEWTKEAVVSELVLKYLGPSQNGPCMLTTFFFIRIRLYLGFGVRWGLINHFWGWKILCFQPFPLCQIVTSDLGYMLLVIGCVRTDLWHWEGTEHWLSAASWKPVPVCPCVLYEWSPV